MALDADTLIVGASAAGLATAAYLKQAGGSFEILEAREVVGNTWRHHYERLHLHTPKSGSSLPGLRMPRAWPRYPARDQVVDYLENYRARHRLSPRYDQEVIQLERRGDAWIATSRTREWSARNVVIATGAARRPVRPTWPGMGSYTGQMLHSSEYRNGDPWIGRPVLVVGFGNSACEQAIDLLERGPSLTCRYDRRSTWCLGTCSAWFPSSGSVSRCGMSRRQLPMRWDGRSSGSRWAISATSA